jgi:phage portal protein BeeE
MRLPWRRPPVATLDLPERATYPLSLDTWASWFSYGGLAYALGARQTLVGAHEELPDDFAGLVRGAYKSNGVIFACMLVRMLLFSEARFKYRGFRSGRPGRLYGTTDLDILEKPWSGGTTGDLLTRTITDADLAGNAYWTRRDGRLVRLRPDWTRILLGSFDDPDVAAWDVDAEVLGYAYEPGGPGAGKPIVYFQRGEVAHFAPIPDPEAMYRGMSWLSPIISEIQGDRAATDHKLKFFEQGATPNLVVTLDVTDPEKYKSWVEVLRESSEGVENAYKTLVLGAGSDVKVVGADFEQIAFKATQGAGETRIAAAAGVPPVIVGLSEGLQAATYSNYGQARRRFADGTMRPLWRNMAGSLAQIIAVPDGSELWYDDRDIPFLQEDQKDAAEIVSTQASALRSLVDAGFKPDTAIEAVDTGDLTRLEHTGLYSVQLQPPGTTAPVPVTPPPSP